MEERKQVKEASGLIPQEAPVEDRERIQASPLSDNQEPYTACSKYQDPPDQHPHGRGAGVRSY